MCQPQNDGVRNFLGDGASLAVCVELADFQRCQVVMRDFVSASGQDAKIGGEEF